MSDLVAFLNARTDEDEAGALLAAREGGTWKQQDPVRYPGHITSLGGTVVYDEGAPDENQAAHIARHDPARVLREVAAKRNILARYQDCLVRQEDPDYPAGVAREQAREYEDFVLPNLAASYSDHPDYDEDWKP